MYRPFLVSVLLGVLSATALASCDGVCACTPPPPELTGTWIGTYTSTLQPGTTYQATLQVTQTGIAVSGTLTTTAGRSANVSGSVNGPQLTATFTFTEGCDGTATTTADITSGDGQLDGSYSASDCLGQYTGGYALARQ